METNKKHKILEIINKNRGRSKYIFDESASLLNDLGIDGDDASEILEEYFQIFQIDKSNFQFEDYFGYEGFNPIVFFKNNYFWKWLEKFNY